VLHVILQREVALVATTQRSIEELLHASRAESAHATGPVFSCSCFFFLAAVVASCNLVSTAPLLRSYSTLS
jgi:hypothetical protein